VAVGDLNRDGRLDLVVANQADNTVSVLLGTGIGNFGAATNFAVGANPNAVAVGDFNEDGRPDLITANQGSATVSLLLNTSAPPTDGGGGGGDGGGGGCFIATAAFGTPLAPQVQLLREVRDKYLLPYRAGRAAVQVYYAVSPPMADFISRSETRRAIVRLGLTPLLGWAVIARWSPAIGLVTLTLPLIAGVVLFARGSRRR